MKSGITLLLALLSATGAGSAGRAAAAPANAQVPAVVRLQQELVPSGWRIAAKATGDLNRDGRPDVALVLYRRKENEDTGSWDLPRLLVVALRSRDGLLHRSVVSDRVVLRHGEGGVFGDPFAGITIRRGVLIINHYGGSRDRRSLTNRYRFQNGEWLHIGATTTASDTLDPGFIDTMDVNLLTGYSIHSFHKGSKSYRQSYYTLQVGPVAHLPVLDRFSNLAHWPGPAIQLRRAGSVTRAGGVMTLTGVMSGGDLCLAASVSGFPMEKTDVVRLVSSSGSVLFMPRPICMASGTDWMTAPFRIPLRALGVTWEKTSTGARFVTRSEDGEISGAPVTIEVVRQRPGKPSTVLFSTSLSPARHDGMILFNRRPGFPHLGDEPLLP